MKKLSALFLSAGVYFSLATPTFAQLINPCPPTGAAGSGFGKLCNVSLTSGNLIGKVFTTIFIIATIIALAFLIIGGIKWITSGGDKTKVEEARGTIVAALVGLILAFLSYFVINLVLTFFTGTSIGGLVLPSL